MQDNEHDQLVVGALQNARAVVGMDRVKTALYRRGLDTPIVLRSTVTKMVPGLAADIDVWQSCHVGTSLVMLAPFDVRSLLGETFSDIPVWWVCAPGFSEAELIERRTNSRWLHVSGVHHPNLYHREVMVQLGTQERPLNAIVSSADVDFEAAGVLLVVYASEVFCAFCAIPIDDAEVVGMQAVFGGAGVNYNPYRIWGKDELEASRLSAAAGHKTICADGSYLDLIPVGARCRI